MELNIPLVLKAILEDYALPINGDHGVVHWARVLENGLRLAEETGANVEVVQLFAVLHDSRRQNEMTDPEHGPRAADFPLSYGARCSIWTTMSSDCCTELVTVTLTNAHTVT